MPRKYRAEDEICTCKYSQGQVDCTRGERGVNCDKCGFNPSVMAVAECWVNQGGRNVNKGWTSDMRIAKTHNKRKLDRMRQKRLWGRV